MKDSGTADLFGYADKPRKRIAYKQTSREALHKFVPISGALDSLIIEAIRSADPGGITCEAIELRIDRKHQAVSGNLRHLVERGVIRDGGEKGRTVSGRSAIKWVIA